MRWKPGFQERPGLMVKTGRASMLEPQGEKQDLP